MSPYGFLTNNPYPAQVFFVDLNGHLSNTNVNNTVIGVRPISFYNSYTKLRQSIAELGYKINH